MNISIDRSTIGMCHLQIQQFTISVTSLLIRLSDFYDRNSLHGIVFTDKGRRVSDGCGGFDLILLNAKTYQYWLPATSSTLNLISPVHIQLFAIPDIHIVTTMFKYLDYFTTYSDILTSQMDHQNSWLGECLSHYLLRIRNFHPLSPLRNT